MTNYLAKGLKIKDWKAANGHLQSLIFTLALLILPILYVLTLAGTLVLGDPTEYTFVAAVLGIAHPPGYAFMTLLGKLFQTIIPFGEIPWRMHLLAAAAGTLAALFVYGTVRTLLKNHLSLSWLPALFAALTVGTAVNFWQHAIHANPHIITATFLAANLFFLTRWWADEQQKTSNPGYWLYAFCLSAGLGVTHHPLTVFGFPAYAIFIFLIRPSIWREGYTLLKMAGFALLGLSVWLYFPLRSPSVPFGPTTMNTVDGFLNHVLARGLSESLPYFSLADQPHRALVFWTLLRLQYALPVIFLALLGLLWPALDRATRQPGRKRMSLWRPLTLYALAFLGHYAFVISLRAQDIMAYLLGPFLVIGLLSGIGLGHLLTLLQQRLGSDKRPLLFLAAALFLFGPALQIARNAPRVSLRHYNEGEAYVEAVFARFAGRGEGAVLLNDWERMTPLWYIKLVAGQWPVPDDVRPEFISTGGQNPWLEGIFTHLPGGPVYLSNFRPDAIAGTEFRLRPDGPFYQVVEPGETNTPPRLTRVMETAGDVEIVGYLLPQSEVIAGDFVPLVLAMRVRQETADFYIPIVRAGDLTFEFTTDSHLVTPRWRPGEVIVERFDFALPHDLPGGVYPLSLDVKNLSQDRTFDLNFPLGELNVTGQAHPPRTDHLLANFRQRVGLVSAVASDGSRRLRAPWPAERPLAVRPGDEINLTLQWESLALAEESYTVFLHLIDAHNFPHVSMDNTPLGGSAPTHLWFPKWLPGQRMMDPYRLQIPLHLPPGAYFIEVGLYEMIGHRRLHISDQNGNLVGDRYILGAVVVE